METDPLVQEARNLPQTIIITFIVARILSIPVGFAVAVLIRRMLPYFTMTLAVIVASSIIITALLFTGLWQYGDINPLDAAAVSFITGSLLVLVAAYFVRRELFKTPRMVHEDDSIWTERLRGKRRGDITQMRHDKDT